MRRGTLHLHAPEAETLARLRRLFTDFARGTRACCSRTRGRRSPCTTGRPRSSQPGCTAPSATAWTATGAQAWRLQPGKCLLEVRPDGRDKGTAIADFMSEQPFRGRRPVFVGDDRGDEHGFAVVERMGGWTVKVGRGAARAQYRLRDVAAVTAWLAAFASTATLRKAHACAPSISP